jgi:hypothetical protein
MWTRFLVRFVASLVCAIIAIEVTHDLTFSIVLFLVTWTFEYLVFVGQNRRPAKEAENAR